MKRVAIYARYSTDNQRDASIEDQVRECRARAEREGWTVVEEYADHAISGATWQRPKWQALLRDAKDRRFDIVLAESLDRFSRDQEHTAHFYKELDFLGVAMVTLAEGGISQLHVGFKGTMNAMYLRDLSEKTRRGLRGRVEAGKSGGGLSYGYAVVRGQTDDDHGEFEVDPTQARIIVEIFERYVAGASPKAIAQLLNKRGVPGPRGPSWSPSTIYGNWRRGTGILNNTLYIGQRIWNRQRFLKDPTTDKRAARPNPPDQWHYSEVKHLRIVDDALWQAAKQRQQETRTRIGEKKLITRARRPTYLFSGMTRCKECGGGYNVQSRDVLRCFNKAVRGTCTNDRTITRREIEARVLKAMQKFFPAAAFDRFCAVYMERVNEVRREQRLRAAAIPREIADNERRQMEILELMLKGLAVERFKRELQQLEDRINALKAQMAMASDEPPLPALHKRMAEDFRTRTTGLIAALDGGDEKQRDQARETLRGFIDKIIIPPGDEPLQLVGKLAEMLSAATGWDGTRLATVVNGGRDCVDTGGCAPPI